MDLPQQLVTCTTFRYIHSFLALAWALSVSLHAYDSQLYGW